MAETAGEYMRSSYYSDVTDERLGSYTVNSVSHNPVPAKPFSIVIDDKYG